MARISSINDWASRAAERVRDEYRSAAEWGSTPSQERVAAIIATFAEPLLKLLSEARRVHHHEKDDSWYCCGACTHPCENDEEDHEHDDSCCVESTMDRVQGKCDCGADAWNKKIEEALK